MASPTRIAGCTLIVLATFCLAPPSRAQRQPQAGVAITDSSALDPISIVGHSQPVETTGMEALGGCVATGHAIAGAGLPSATALIGSVHASDPCSELQTAPSGVSDVGTSADGVRIYLVKGPAAVAPPFTATLSEHLHGTLSTTKGLANYFGAPTTRAGLVANVDLTAGASHTTFYFSDSASDGAGGTQPPASPFFLDQSAGSTATYAIDHTLTSDESLPGAYVWNVHFHLECDVDSSWALFGPRPAGAPDCNFDSGDTSVSLAAVDPSVIFEPVTPVKPTAPRSAAYLSPVSGPIQAFLGTGTAPTTIASGPQDLGDGATGDGAASGDVPVVALDLLDTTGAASHVDQSAVVANGSGTVVSEGRGAVSLRYHATLLNGLVLADYPSGLPLSIQYPTVDATLAETKSLDPGIVEHASLQVTADVQGAPFFHFVTMSLGASNEDPPGVTGDLRTLCQDHSTGATQSCTVGQLQDDIVSARPDENGDLVLTVQTDCATGLTHPQGPLPAAHLACDASHTVAAKLVSRDANVLLTALPEPSGLPFAALAALGLVVATRRR